MAIVENTQHVNQALGLLVQQFKDKPRVAAFLRALMNQIQKLETVLIELYSERALDTAVGVQLDGIGEIIGEDRLGRSDDAYRIGLRGRIRLNLASGTVEDIYGVLDSCLSGLYGLALEQIFPASILVTITGALPTATATEAARAISLARAAGIGSQMVYGEDLDAASFFFSSGDTEEASAAQGWADDAQTSGGKFAEALGA